MLKGIGREATYYYHPDHLGSVSVVSNHRGEPYERVEYLPFGEIWIEETDPATGYIPFRFTSKELDEETGLYYYGARYYEPTTSRWISADPAGFELINPMDEDGEGGWQPKQSYSVIEATNWYSYTSNNPVLYVDPTGEFMSPSKIKGYARNMIAGVAAMGVLAVADAAGQVGNFVSNLVTGDVEVSGSIGLQAGGGLIGGTLEVSKDGVNFTPSSSMTPEGAFEALQDFAGMPITIGVDGIETTFDAKVVKVGVSLTNDGGETMTLGIEAGADLFDALGVKAGVGVEASTQDGPFATLMNGKSEGMNKVAAEAIGVTKPESWLQ